MSASTVPSQFLGYLTFVDFSNPGLGPPPPDRQLNWGMVGGFLLVNQLARPLEFHCTAPIVANRTQQILYGPTWRGYVMNELAGPALIQESKLRPKVLLTDLEEGIALQAHTNLPVFLCQGNQLSRTEPTLDTDENEAMLAWLSRLADVWDLSEPFQRIREAIGEAHQSAA